MKRDEVGKEGNERKPEAASADETARGLPEKSIGESIDHLVEYLFDNGVNNIHPLIMGEVERRLIIRVLERSRGNKLQAAERLGISRNTFHRKIQKMKDSLTTETEEGQA
jgi:DNA-binding protein Fis